MAHEARAVVTAGTLVPTNSSTFPLRLHYVLAQMEGDGLEHVASWQSHGCCFTVHDRDEFEKIILPSWFRMSKYSSFQRQLNIYGFLRIVAGNDKNGYYHEKFLRHDAALARGIQRVAVKGTGERSATLPAQVPNFSKNANRAAAVEAGRPAVATVRHAAPGQSGMAGGLGVDTRAAYRMSELEAVTDHALYPPLATRAATTAAAAPLPVGAAAATTSNISHKLSPAFRAAHAAATLPVVAAAPTVASLLGRVDAVPIVHPQESNSNLLLELLRREEERLQSIQVNALLHLAAAVPSPGWPTLNVASLPFATTSSPLVHPHHNGLYAELARQERQREELRQAMVAQSILHGNLPPLPTTRSLLPQPAAAALAPSALEHYAQQQQLQDLLNRLHP